MPPQYKVATLQSTVGMPAVIPSVSQPMAIPAMMRGGRSIISSQLPMVGWTCSPTFGRYNGKQIVNVALCWLRAKTWTALRAGAEINTYR